MRVARSGGRASYEFAVHRLRDGTLMGTAHQTLVFVDRAAPADPDPRHEVMPPDADDVLRRPSRRSSRHAAASGGDLLRSTRASSCSSPERGPRRDEAIPRSRPRRLRRAATGSRCRAAPDSDVAARGIAPSRGSRRPASSERELQRDASIRSPKPSTASRHRRRAALRAASSSARELSSSYESSVTGREREHRAAAARRAPACWRRTNDCACRCPRPCDRSALPDAP